ncbi:hypothetical protein DV736_g4465, partial [Chaetothyriales sp. CBS 134916]
MACFGPSPGWAPQQGVGMPGQAGAPMVGPAPALFGNTRYHYHTRDGGPPNDGKPPVLPSSGMPIPPWGFAPGVSGAAFGGPGGAAFGGPPGSAFGGPPGAAFGGPPGSAFGGSPGAAFGGPPGAPFGGPASQPPMGCFPGPPPGAGGPPPPAYTCFPTSSTTPGPVATPPAPSNFLGGVLYAPKDEEDVPAPGNRVNGRLARVDDGSGVLLPEHMTTFHVLNPGCHPERTKHFKRDMKFKVQLADSQWTVRYLIKQLGGLKILERQKEWAHREDLVAVEEWHELGNGEFRPGSTVYYNSAKAACTLAEMGWGPERGKAGGQPAVWVVLYPIPPFAFGYHTKQLGELVFGVQRWETERGAKKAYHRDNRTDQEPGEITKAGDLIQSVWPANTDLRFKAITLFEPEKKSLLPYLDAEHSGGRLPFIPRKALSSYYIRNTDRFHEAIVNLSEGKIESNVRLGANVHGSGDYEEIVELEKQALEHEAVKAEIAKLKLPEGAVVCADPWIYGSDGVDDDHRYYQVFMYMRDPANASEADSNHYAFPLPFSPVFNASTFELVRIDQLPTGADKTLKPIAAYQAKAASEYVSEYQELRKDVKALHVLQPDGPSFTVTTTGETGWTVAWQKWTFRVGFNQREGMVLYDVRYESRPLFYRLSLSDMNIPYADPRAPFHKKSAFDLGDAGAGITANNLQLGCDCLGHIQYLSSVVSDDKGKPVPLPNCVCVHEVDSGISWKHTNYRTGRAAVARSRELVLQSIMTASNYEYVLAFVFNQAGELAYEVRATGILSTQPIDHDLDKTGVAWGTVVHPGVLAVHHQHNFSLRVDPMIDGPNNSVVYQEAHAMPVDKDWNPHGNGYVVTEHTITTSGGYDLDTDANRVFKIVNPAVKNPINGKSVAYKIIAPPFQKILSSPDSFNFKRAEFSDHNIYVTAHRDRELYSGGWYTNQSRGGTGVRSWAARKDKVEDSDVVVWVQFGINHVPRTEDFPVMPAETLKVMLKPVNFFAKNPALDVPPSTQTFNQSTLVAAVNHQPACH